MRPREIFYFKQKQNTFHFLWCKNEHSPNLHLYSILIAVHILKLKWMEKYMSTHAKPDCETSLFITQKNTSKNAINRINRPCLLEQIETDVPSLHATYFAWHSVHENEQNGFIFHVINITDRTLIIPDAVRKLLTFASPLCLQLQRQRKMRR